MLSKIEQLIEKIELKLIQTRRELHRIPELAFKEKKTAAFIKNRLDELGIPCVSGIAKTGIVATIEGTVSGNGKVLAIRADMDALPIHEETGVDYASTHDGFMHACGHDAHVAILLATAEVLTQLKDEFFGTVKLIFQPAEEAAGGAKPMIDEGIFENPTVDACIALHVWPDLSAGTVQVKDGAVFASPDIFNLTIKGRGGHGAMPELCVNPLSVGAEILQKLHDIPNEIEERCVVTVCALNGGDFNTIIPDTVELKGTARAFSHEVRKQVAETIEQNIAEICEKYHADFKLDYKYLYPPTINDAEMSRVVFDVTTQVAGDCADFGGEPSMGGEDFAYYAEKVPSCIFRLGCSAEYPFHNPKFDIDERCLSVGVKVFVSAALKYLAI